MEEEEEPSMHEDDSDDDSWDIGESIATAEMKTESKGSNPDVKPANDADLEAAGDPFDVETALTSAAQESSAPSQAKLISLVSLIFCRAISREFRRPVELIHPRLWPDYKGKIKHPMDFGTLLFSCYKGKSTAASVRDNIRLICANAIEYGKDLLDFVGTARHLEFFASMLYEELLSVPFKPVYVSQTEFLVTRSANRMSRFQLIRKEPLLLTELNDLHDVLKKWPRPRAPAELTAAVAESVQLTSAALSAKTAFMTSLDEPGAEDISVSLADIMRPVLECCQGTTVTMASMNEAITSGKLPAICYLYVDFSPNEPPAAAGVRNVMGPVPELVTWLRAVDEALGGWLALVCERCLRGCPFSCTWARPLSVVWVQSSRFPRCVEFVFKP
jgi:hypothetical protein